MMISTWTLVKGEGGRWIRLTRGILGLMILVLAWNAASGVLGPLALPAPVDTVAALGRLIADGRAFSALAETGGRVLAAFGLAILIGAALGLIGGTLPLFRDTLGPLITMMLAVPPVAWIVLALLWFGMGGTAVVFTVVIAVMPMPYLATLEAVRTQDPKLVEMVKSFGLSRWQSFRSLLFPHLVSYLLPAMVSAFGLAWNIAVMAELLGSHHGIGSGLARARANLDTAESFAWIVLVVAIFIIVKVAVLEPLSRWFEPWRLRGAGQASARGGKVREIDGHTRLSCGDEFRTER